MKLLLDKQEQYTILELQDEKLDTRNAPTLKGEFLMLSSEGTNNLILDLSQTKYIDSSGLSALLIANRLCSQSGGALVLCGVTPHVRKMFEISCLDSVLNIVPTRKEAIESIFLSTLEQEIEQEIQDEFSDEEYDYEEDDELEDSDSEEENLESEQY
ncbi:MAG: STAS domain-containing protein [Bacteroidia bacterium]|nr:STAS domain-containing protein [Bacteroidia bacterium]